VGLVRNGRIRGFREVFKEEFMGSLLKGYDLEQRHRIPSEEGLQTR
jgi:hypothetical protein